MTTALISGVTGQDGRYLSEYLASLGYEVFGLVRGQNNAAIPTLLAENPALHVVNGDLADQSSLISALEIAQPDEIYHLGAISHVGISFNQPGLTAEITGLGTLRLLEAMRRVCPTARFYQASSSEMFGKVREVPQTESTPFHPRSPYGTAKVFAHQTAVNYREAYGLHVSCGILFNHESPRRGLEFVTRKVTQAVARIHTGQQDSLKLGNLDASRDWGYAGDYVRAMQLMLAQDSPNDYVIATGRTWTIRDLLSLAFSHVDRDWQDYVSIDPTQVRPSEVDLLRGDATKARYRLGWKPTVPFEQLIPMMVDADLAAWYSPASSSNRP